MDGYTCKGMFLPKTKKKTFIKSISRTTSRKTGMFNCNRGVQVVMKTMEKIVTTAVIIAALSTQVHAGLFATTVHSRANCINNESITWWNGHPFDWRTISMHVMSDGSQHYVDSDWNYKDVSRAVHWGEGVYGGARVWGFHYESNYSTTAPFDQTYAEGCNIIDGWFYN